MPLHNQDYVPGTPNVDDVFDEGDDVSMQYLDGQDEEIDHGNDDSADENDDSVYEDEDEESDDPATSDIDDQVDSQIDEATGLRVGWYTISPNSLKKAKIQGVALLRALFVDSNGEISKNIARVKGFSAQHASNSPCKRVQKYLNWGF